MKTMMQTLLMVLSVLLLLVFVTASARARSNPNPTPPVPFEVKGQIRWKKDMGLIPIGPGKILASNSACSPFFIVAYEYNASFSGGSRILAYSSRSTSQPTEQEEYYVCDYSIQVPPDKSMFVRAGVGDVDLLPKTLERSQDPLMSGQPYYLTDRWIGGTNSRPPAGWERGFTQRPTGSTKYLEFVLFEMLYFRSHSDPTASSTSEKGPSPLLSRASSFAGVWHAKLGEAALELILQQTGKQVTGQVKMNSADIGVIRAGIVVGNTLRFTIVRAGKALGNGTNLPDEYVGTGELVMDAGGTSFTGNVLGTVTSGTFVGR